MSKKRLTGYTFDASAQTVVHADFSDITLEGIQLITNTTNNVVIYQFNNPALGGTLSTDTLTLTFDTTSMSDTDKLMILVEDGKPPAYTDGDTDATPTGTLVMYHDTDGDTVRAANTDDGLPVSFTSEVAVRPSLDHTADFGLFNEDTAHLSDHSGQFVLGVRNDAAATTLTDTDGDYSGIAVDNKGRVFTNVSTLPGDVEADIDQIRDQIDLITPDIEEIRVDADAIRVAVETIDNAISGSEMQVDVVAALPAGNNNIGDVDIASIAAGNNNIGDVDVASLPALAAGTNAIGKLLPPDVDVTLHTNYAKKYYTNSGAVTDGIVWSPAAGKRFHVVSMFLNTSAAATVTFEDDKAGGDEAIMKMELAANSGMTINFGEKYPLASGEDAADLIVTTSAGNIYITVTGYEI